TCGVNGLKNYIAGEINTTHFDLYKNSIHPKNLMDKKKAFFNYFDTVDDSNLIVVIHPITPKTPSSK
ncbi:7033_t:CDS:1, partial [Funneliformis geosporum]